MLLQQVVEGQNRRLVWDPLADQVDPRKPAHRRHLDQGVLHGRVAQRVPVLHQVDPQHGLVCIGRSLSLGACLRVERLNQINQRLPRHHLVHLGQKLLTLGQLLSDALLVIPKAQLLASHQSSLGQRLLPYSCSDRVGFPESPYSKRAAFDVSNSD